MSPKRARAWLRARTVKACPDRQGGLIRSFLIPRTVAPTETPREMVEAWTRAKDGNLRKVFYNRVLGRPYIDADQLPVTLAHCEEAARIGVSCGLVWEKSGADAFMGIDQMGGFNAVIIKKRMPDGRQAVVHVEAVYAEEPFERCGELMEQYGVVVCVVEQLPNVNSTRKFANRFSGRVFMAGSAALRDDAMAWGDTYSRSDRKTQVDDRSRHTVNLNQYKCMQTSLFRVRDKLCLFPHPSLLEQTITDAGAPKRVVILRDMVFLHLTKVALVVDDDPDMRKPKARVQKVGLDPHFAFANMLCDVAWARSYGTAMFYLQGAPSGSAMASNPRQSLPGAPEHIIQLLESAKDVNKCGTCDAYDKAGRRCRERSLLVDPGDAGCDYYVENAPPGES